MKLDLNIDKYSDLDGRTHLTEARKDIAKMKWELAQYEKSIFIEAKIKIATQLDLESPDRVKHKLTQNDVNSILIALGMHGIISSPTGKVDGHTLVLNAYAELTGQHPDWLEKVKYQNWHGALICRGISLAKLSKEPEVKQYYSMVQIDDLDLDVAFNNALGQIQAQVLKRYKDMYKDQRIKELEHTVSRLERDMVDNTNMLNNRINDVEVIADMDWRDRAVQLKVVKPNIKNKDIADIVAMSIDSVKKFMGNSETKAKIVALRVIN